MGQSPEIPRCPKCGRFMGIHPGHEWCLVCVTERENRISLVEEALNRAGKKSPEEIAQYTGLPLPEIHRIVTTTQALNYAVDSQSLCRRCGKAPAQRGSPFCFGCRIELYNALQEATHKLANETAARAAQSRARTSASGIRRSLEERRDRERASDLFKALEDKRDQVSTRLLSRRTRHTR